MLAADGGTGAKRAAASIPKGHIEISADDDVRKFLLRRRRNPTPPLPLLLLHLLLLGGFPWSGNRFGGDIRASHSPPFSSPRPRDEAKAGTRQGPFACCSLVVPGSLRLFAAGDVQFAKGGKIFPPAPIRSPGLVAVNGRRFRCRRALLAHPLRCHLPVRPASLAGVARPAAGAGLVGRSALRSCLFFFFHCLRRSALAYHQLPLWKPRPRLLRPPRSPHIVAAYRRHSSRSSHLALRHRRRPSPSRPRRMHAAWKPSRTRANRKMGRSNPPPPIEKTLSCQIITGGLRDDLTIEHQQHSQDSRAGPRHPRATTNATTRAEF